VFDASEDDSIAANEQTSMKTKLLLAACLVPSLVGSLRADSVVVFNEVMYHPATNEPTMEWVELRNQLAADVDISGWALGGAIGYTFPSNTIVRGGGVLVVALSPSALTAATGLSGVLGPFTGRLGNNADHLVLRNNSGRVMDELTYGVEGDWPVAPDGSGVSLAKLDRDTASGPAANWGVSEQVGGTPGAENFAVAGAIPPDTRLVAIDTAWKYEASGTDLGTGWREPGFSDGSWAARASFTNRAIPGLFNTGVGANGVVVAPGGNDPHFIVTAAPQGNVGTNAIAILNHPAWLANDATSSWIGIHTPGADNVAAGAYYYRTTFSLAGFIPATARLNLVVAVDNDLNDVVINGGSSGLITSGFAAFNPALILASGFVAGTNTLEFRTFNAGTGDNPHGFRATLSGTALGANTNAPLALGPATYYFRKSFGFSGDPAHTRLRLNPIIADGAVVYLNGVEVFRQNMPAGAVSYATPALSNVPAPDLSGLVEIPAASLVAGENVLAVEVHQATGSPDGPLFGADLISTPIPVPPAPPITLAFNELSPATNAGFWLELVNYGTNGLSLDGCVIAHDGAADHEYIFLAGGPALAPGAFRVLTDSTLGFHPESGDKLYLLTPTRNAVLDGVVVKKRARARLPQATGQWFDPDTATPGGANSFAFRDEVVINEIMYHHALLPGTNGALPEASPEAWIELFNRSPNAVDLTGWELDGGITYHFTPGQTIAPGGYLVVADDAAYMRTLYPSLEVVGNFGGRLAAKSDVIILKDPAGNPADEVRYFDRGHWPEYADRGGSSLELRDPNADNSKAESWAASDESGKSSWQTYTYRLVANIPSGSGQPTTWQDFIFGLQDGGECLIDDLSVVESPATAPVQIIANGDFENGLTGWRVLGTHGRSVVEPEPGNPGKRVLHLIATGPQEHMHNHIERTLNTGRTIVNGREYEVSFRARWLAGNNLLNTRLYFNRVGRTTALPVPPLNGTPGAQNSRYAANIGPTFGDFGHQQVVPAPGEPVTVSVHAEDPQGVASARVYWSVNSGGWTSAPMSSSGGGRYTGTIPGQSGGTVVQFYVEATDALGAAATFPAKGRDSGALYKVEDGQAILSLAHNVRLILTPSNIDLLHGTAQGVNQTNVMSNDLIPCTVVYDERRAYYDCGVHLRGSQRGRYSDTRTGFHIEFPPDDLFQGVHPVMLIDRSGAGDATANRQEEIVLKHMLNRAGGLPGTYSEICRVIAPRSAHTGPAQWWPRHEDLFIETAFENGGDGTMFEMELIYFPTATNVFGYKNPQPDDVVGTDFTDLGNDKEIYRYNFMIKNHRDADDYSRFIAFCKALSLPNTSPALQAQAEQILDMDQWMRAYAFVSLCSVGDMYTYGNNHNWFMYLRPSDGKLLYFPWDMDFVFTRGSSGALVGDQNLGKLVNLTPNLRRMYGHMLDIIDVSFNSSYMTYWTDHYDNFAPGQSYAGTLNNIGARATFVRNTINGAGGNAAFAITSSTNLTTGSNLVTLTGTAPVSAYTIKVDGQAYPITWTTISAWTMRVPVDATSNTLAVTAYDVRGNPLTNFSRTVTVTYTNAIPGPAGAVVINEIMYHPAAPEASYVELFNTSSSFTFDLSGWRLNGLSFTFPSGSFIAPRQYLVLAKDVTSYLAAYGSNAPMPLATYDGVLQNDGETLTLFKPGPGTNQETVIDKVRYESVLPWSPAANGTGSSLQLVDAAQRGDRPANWFSDYAASYTNTAWRRISVTGPIGTLGRLLIYLGEPGELYVDDVWLVTGTNAGVGYNYVRNGDFESPLYDDPPLTNSWVVGTNYFTNSAISTEFKHSGSASLHMVCAFAGTALNRIIYQTLSPAPTNTTVCTLSFWYLPTTNASTLNLRIQNSSSLTTVTSVRPNFVPALIYATPGSNNVTSVGSLPLMPPLWLNEVQAENLTGLTDTTGHRVPWIELYNAGTTAEPVEGLYLANNYTNLTQWAFPTGAVLNPGEFKVIFADGATGESTADEWHTSFALAPGSGAVALARVVNGQPQVLDYINYRAVRPDRSFGSYPDGQPFDRLEFYRPTPGRTNDATAAPLEAFINEWMAVNNSTLLNTNNSNRYDDWFELYNPTDQPAPLQGYYLTDDLANKAQFPIPPGFVIPARGFLLVWADNRPDLNDTNSPDLHVNFRLDQAGEQIGLVASDGTLIDGLAFGPQFNDITEGRYTDGATVRQFMTVPTPRAPNVRGNTAPTLATIPNIFSPPGQPISFAVLASDPEAPPQTLRFSLDPGAPAGATIDPVSGAFQWTPAASNAASPNWITVRVTDDGLPSLSATRVFAVFVQEPLTLSGVTHLEGGDFTFTVGVTPGKFYRVEYKDDLGVIEWTPLPPDWMATSGSLTITNRIDAAPQRFFRVLELE
jgi:hypothetical protein